MSDNDAWANPDNTTTGVAALSIGEDAWGASAPAANGNGNGGENAEAGNRDSRDRDRDREGGRDRSRSPGGRGRDGGDRGRGDGQHNPGNNLHVSGLSSKVDNRHLEDAFSKYGKVQKAQVMYDPHSRDSRGFGFVTMENPEDADAAVAALNGTDLMGRPLSVEKARRGRARTPTPGRYYGPPKREEYYGRHERPYEPRSYDSRYNSSYDRPRGGGGGGRYDESYDRGYDRRYDDRGGGGGGGRDYDRRGGGGGGYGGRRDYDRRYDERY